MSTTAMSSLVPSRLATTRLLTRRIMAERRRLVAGITIGGYLLALATTALYSSLGAEYSELLQEMPAALASMLGDAELGTVEGWLQAEVFSLMGPGLVVGSSVAIGSGALAGAEQTGRLVLISAGPVARSTIVFSVTTSTVLVAALTTGGLVLGIFSGAVVAGISLSVGKILAASLLLMLLGIALGLIALAIGAITGSRGAAMAGALVTAITSYCVFSFFPLSERLDFLSKVSLWHPYAAGRPLTDGLHLGHVMVLLVCIAAALVVSVISFERRDLAN